MADVDGCCDCVPMSVGVELRKSVPDGDEDRLITGEGVSRCVAVESTLIVVNSDCETQLVRVTASVTERVLVGELVGQNVDVAVARRERDSTEDGKDEGEIEVDAETELIVVKDGSVVDETGALRVVDGEAVLEAITETDGGADEVTERDCSAGDLDRRADAECVVDSMAVMLSAVLPVIVTDSDLHGEEVENALSDLLALSESAKPV